MAKNLLYERSTNHGRQPEDQLDAMRKRLQEQDSLIEKLKERLPKQPSSGTSGYQQQPTRNQPAYQPNSYNQHQQQPIATGNIQPGETLRIQIVSFPGGVEFVERAKQPLQVESSGEVPLGAEWGRVKVAGKSLAEAESIIAKQIQQNLDLIRELHSEDAPKPFEGNGSTRYLIRDVRVQITRPSSFDQWGGGAF